MLQQQGVVCGILCQAELVALFRLQKVGDEGRLWLLPLPEAGNAVLGLEQHLQHHHESPKLRRRGGKERESMTKQHRRVGDPQRW